MNECRNVMQKIHMRVSQLYIILDIKEYLRNNNKIGMRNYNKFSSVSS